jgi:hypothetical protein
VKLALTQTLTAVNTSLYRVSLGTSRGAVRAAIYMANKLEQQLQQHHGGDMERTKRDILSDQDVLRPTGPVPERPII